MSKFLVTVEIDGFGSGAEAAEWARAALLHAHEGRSWNPAGPTTEPLVVRCVPTATQPAQEPWAWPANNIQVIKAVREITGRSFKKLVTTTGAAIGGWGNEHTPPTETTGPKLVELEFTPGTLWAEPRATRELLEDSDKNIEAWLADEVGITFEEQENAGFATGNGVNCARGLFDYPTVANASYAWGSIGYVAAGADGAFATPSSSVSPVDAFTDLMHALKPVYRANGKWLMADATVAKIRKFKDGQGNLQWKPGALVDQPYVELFLGKPIAYDDNVPAVASNAMSVAFGDFKRAYIIVDRVGTHVIRDDLTAKPYVKFYTRRRVGGGVQNFEAVKFMKMAAS